MSKKYIKKKQPTITPSTGFINNDNLGHARPQGYTSGNLSSQSGSKNSQQATGQSNFFGDTQVGVWGEGGTLQVWGEGGTMETWLA